ncbi:CPBP family intramembrane glutamic endopeptidase [Halalkalibacter urbisdiaboli]|uniref:CPBP family intramembrane glutamic endopeptidase n=1 Tax=Halalkalibacter urbisdiaboli TaxID=1960589 RepID=UPI000B43AA03|nr:CPBP family intramembrane glutamic endopeptidase [Halalkalibacter urbisdiaboli]
MKQQDILANISDRDLLLNVYASQGLMLVCAFIGGYFIFSSWSDILGLVFLDFWGIFVIGGGFAVLVVIVNILLARWLPAHLLDDGGINRRIFRSLTLPQMLVLCTVVAIAEEVLFRAVIQTGYGLITASLIFAFIHFRYIKKVVLFLSVLILSFSLGLLFEWTGNILVTMFAHFLIDFLFGIMLQKNLLNSQA